MAQWSVQPSTGGDRLGSTPVPGVFWPLVCSAQTVFILTDSPYGRTPYGRVSKAELKALYYSVHPVGRYEPPF